MSREAKILTAVLVVIVGGMIGLFALANQGSTPAADTTKAPDTAALVRADSHKLNAGKVTVVEFGDYQCPACGAAYPNLKQLTDTYKDQVTFVFRNYPLTQLHKNATAAANAAEEAAAQGKFWEMHDKLYETQNEWSTLADPSDKFAEYANALGMDGAKVKTAVTEQKYKDVIAKDVADGDLEKVNATPTLYVNGKFQTSSTFTAMRDAVEAELKAKQS